MDGAGTVSNGSISSGSDARNKSNSLIRLRQQQAAVADQVPEVAGIAVGFLVLVAGRPADCDDRLKIIVGRFAQG
jgi:hypothetical protein